MKKFLLGTNALAIIASLLWASAFVGIKIGLKYQTPFQFAGFRFTISGLMLMLYFRNYKTYWTQVLHCWKYVALIASLQTVVQYMFFLCGINLLPASISALIIGASPLFIAIVAHFSFKNDKIDWIKGLSICLGIIGVGIISFGRHHFVSGVSISIAGVVFLLMNNLVSGATNVLAAKKPAEISPVVLSSSSLFFGGIALTLISLPIEGIGLRTVSIEYFGALAWLSFLSAAAFSIWYTLLQRPGVKVSELNLWKFLIPVAGALLSWIIIPDERADAGSIIGMGLIACALLILNYANRRRARKQI